jgi:zinc resistance-associated protein
MSAHALAGCSAPAAFGTLKPASLLTFAVSASPDNPPATASGGLSQTRFVAAFCRAAPPWHPQVFRQQFQQTLGCTLNAYTSLLLGRNGCQTLICLLPPADYYSSADKQRGRRLGVSNVESCRCGEPLPSPSPVPASLTPNPRSPGWLTPLAAHHRDMRAFQAARLAALRAGLALNTDQEKHWPAFEQAMRELQQLRLNRITAIRDARREGSQPVVDPAERMRQRATRLSESGAVLKRLADATEPLYSSLDDAQKRRFAILTRTEGPRGGWQRRGREGGEPGMQRGPRRTDAAPNDVAPVDGAAQGKQIFMRKTMDGETVDPVFTRKTVDGDVFAQAFVSKTVDGVMVGRVFGTKTVNGDLMIGETALFTGKTLEPVRVQCQAHRRQAGRVQPQDHHCRAAGVRTSGGGEPLTNFASAAIVLPAPRHDRRRMGAAGFNRPAAFPF